MAGAGAGVAAGQLVVARLLAGRVFVGRPLRQRLQEQSSLQLAGNLQGKQSSLTCRESSHHGNLQGKQSSEQLIDFFSIIVTCREIVIIVTSACRAASSDGCHGPKVQHLLSVRTC